MECEVYFRSTSLMKNNHFVRADDYLKSLVSSMIRDATMYPNTDANATNRKLKKLLILQIPP